MIVFPVLIPGQNFLFPGTRGEITKCHGKGREIWGLYSRESWETGIPAHPWSVLHTFNLFGTRMSEGKPPTTNKFKDSLKTKYIVISGKPLTFAFLLLKILEFFIWIEHWNKSFDLVDWRLAYKIWHDLPDWPKWNFVHGLVRRR